MTTQFRSLKSNIVYIYHIYHISAGLECETEGSNRWWKKAKSMARISKSSSGLPTLQSATSTDSASIATEKVNLLVSFFAQQCMNPDKTLLPGAQYRLPREHPSFEFPPAHELTVLQYLKLSPVKYSGCKIITNRVLQETAVFIAASLSYLYNLSLNTCVFPDEWKVAIVTPVFKQRGKADDPTSYRPILLLPAIGKV